VVFVGRSESSRQLYLRHLDQSEALLLPNTDDAFCPFFSPDSEWIAFGQKGKLRKISVLGGPATTICDATDVRGGTWGADGTILFAPNPRSGIWRVPATGGEPVKLTDAGVGDATPTHRWPSLLPDGKTANLRYRLSSMRRARSTHHRTLRSPACAVSSLRRLRADVDLARIVDSSTFRQTR
jgi:serine/threonine-protein kinase